MCQLTNVKTTHKVSSHHKIPSYIILLNWIYLRPLYHRVLGRVSFVTNSVLSFFNLSSLKSTLDHPLRPDLLTGFVFLVLLFLELRDRSPVLVPTLSICPSFSTSQNHQERFLRNSKEGFLLLCRSLQKLVSLPYYNTEHFPVKPTTDFWSEVTRSSFYFSGHSSNKHLGNPLYSSLRHTTVISSPV